MDDLPKEPKPFDPEMEAAIRRNVAIYWDVDAPYERRIVARHALQALAVEGFKELLFVVDALRMDSATRAMSSGMWDWWKEPVFLLKPETGVKIADIPPELAHMFPSGARPIDKPEDDK